MQEIDVVIIGAGAAGLMCAIEAGKRGRTVLVLDHANKPGKKILMSGGGRCNFTNLKVTPDNFISHNRHFCRSALSRYTPHDFIGLVEKHHVSYHEKTLGQLFCDHKSKDIVNLLLAECQSVAAKVQCDTEVLSVKPLADGFVIKTPRGDYSAQSLVIATGGLSIPTLGASAFGYKLAEQFGLKVWPTRAALVPFTLHDKEKSHLQTLPGVALDCQVSVNQQSFQEAMLFTHRGLSGPAMLQISSYWQPGDTLTVNMLPQLDLQEYLLAAKKDKPNSSLKSILQPLLPKRLLDIWLIDNLSLQEISLDNLQKIATSFQAWQIKPNNTEGYPIYTLSVKCLMLPVG